MKKITLLSLLFVVSTMFAQTFPVQPRMVDNSSNDPLDVKFSDVDGDGDLDLVAAIYTGDEVVWYKNDGKQNYTKQTVATGVNGAIYVNPVDIDADGDIDIVVNAYDGGKTIVFTNDGSENFTAVFTDNNANGSNYNTVADVDNDGKLDIVSTNLGNGQLVWYKNNGLQNGSLNFNRHLITSFPGANSVEATDLNGDGTMDLLVTSFSGDKISWFSNTIGAAAPMFTEHIIDSNAVGALTAYFSDIDGDGDLDVVASISGRYLATGGDQVVWYKNDGTNFFGSKIVIDAASDYAAYAQAADFDNDGDMDIVASATNSNELRWYENDGSENFTTHVITGAAIGDSYGIALADVNGDGDIDIALAAPGNNSVRLIENATMDIVITDPIFEEYLETHNIWSSVAPFGSAQSIGDGTQNNQLVNKAKANGTKLLTLTNLGIGDTTGFDEFTSVLYFLGEGNNFTEVDFSTMSALKQLRLQNSPNLLAIDASNNPQLTLLQSYSSPNLATLNYKNGANTLMQFFNSAYTPMLNCIQVDDENYAGLSSWTIDATTNNFSEDCSKTIWKGVPADWTNGPPNSTIDATIEVAYDASVDGDIEAKSLTIDTTGILEVSNNTSVTIDGDITNNGSVVVEKGGSVIQISDTATVTGTAANFDVEVITSPMPDSRYTYFSAPTKTATMGVFSSWAQMNRNFKFDGTTQNWAYTGATEAMIPGVGYIVRPASDASGVITGTGPFDFTTNFDGAFNNGVITAPLYANVAGAPDPLDDSSSLVGNPYPSGLNPTLLLQGNTSAANALHFWAHSSNGANWANEGYVTKNLGGYTNIPSETISVGQGFFVDATANGTLTFNNSMRVADTGAFLRPQNSNLDKVWVNIEANAQVGAQLLVGFNPICSDGFDAQYDARSFNGTSTLDFYSFGIGANTSNLAIQTRGELDVVNDTSIPLGFSLLDASITNLTISIDHFENLEHYEVLLLDNVTNTTHDLKIADYVFTLSATGAIDTRFELVFSRNALATNETQIESNELIVANAEASFNVTMLNGKTITNLTAFDILGKQIVDVKPNSSIFEVKTSLKQGTILIIKATLENGQVVTKKFVKL